MTELPAQTVESTLHLYIEESLAWRAVIRGIASIELNPSGITETVQLATSGKTIDNLGALVLTPWLEYMPSASNNNYFYVPSGVSLQEATQGVPTSFGRLSLTAEEQNLTLLAISSYRPTEERLARGVYRAACQWTTNNSTYVSSREDKWMGRSMGVVLGLAADVVDWAVEDMPSIGEYTIPYIGGAVGGLMAGGLLLAPAIRQLRKQADMKIIRQNMPLSLRYQQGESGALIAGC